MVLHLDVKTLISRLGDKQDRSRSGSPEVLELQNELESEREHIISEARSQLKRIFIGKIPSNDIRAGRKIVLKKNKEIESEQFDLVSI